MKFIDLLEIILNEIKYNYQIYNDSSEDSFSGIISKELIEKLSII